MEGKPDWLPGFHVRIYCNREGDPRESESNRNRHNQPERRHRQDHDLRKSGGGPCHGGQKGAGGGRRPQMPNSAFGVICRKKSYAEQNRRK